MCVAIRLGLALCVALTIQLAHFRNDEHLPNNEEENCNRLVAGIDYKHILYFDIEMLIQYGSSVRLMCFRTDYGLQSQLAIMKQRKLLPTKTNSHYIVTDELWPQENTEFICTIKESVCRISIFISVTPALKVISPNMHFDTTQDTNYTIQYGKSITVQCTGPNASGLILAKNGKQLPTHLRNNKVNWSEMASYLQISTYVCTDVNTGYNHSIFIRVVPLIYGTEIAYKNGIYQYTSTYEDSTSALLCYGPRAVEFINVENENKELLTENLNETTVKLSINGLELGKSVLACVDSKIPYYMSKVHVTILPRMVIIAPNIHVYSNYLYVAKAGDPLEIICTGSDASQLTIAGGSHNNSIRTETLERVNETTIKWSKNKLKQGDTAKYICSTGEVKSALYIEVIPHPEALNFRCVSYNLQYLNCTWSTSSNNNTFALSYVGNGLPVRIYTEEDSFVHSLMLTRYCIWYRTGNPGYPGDVVTLIFIMESCNIYGCFNQTFQINHLSIVKVDPLYSISLFQSDSGHAKVSLTAAWIGHHITVAGESFTPGNGDFYFRVEYQYLGMEPLEANSLLVKCDEDDYCTIELTLPCPKQSYEVRVYQKLKITVGEEFWSIPTSKTIYIEGKNDDQDIVDRACYKPRITKYVMMHSVQVQREEVYLNKIALKEKLRSLQKKLDRIQTYLKHNEDEL